MGPGGQRTTATGCETNYRFHPVDYSSFHLPIELVDTGMAGHLWLWGLKIDSWLLIRDDLDCH